MNKEIIKKWVKRIGIAIGSAIAIVLLYAISVITYQEVYIPYHIDSLYQEGLTNPSKAEWVVKQLQDVDISTEDTQDKAVKLIKIYAKKGFIWAKITLEQYNNDNEIPLNSKTSINNHIWGITLGKSTKEDVLNYLDNQKIWHQELKNGSITQGYKDFEFAGVYWNYVYYYYVNDKVYKITFIYRPEGSANSDYIKLKNMLTAKYALSKNFKKESPLSFSIKDSNTLIEINDKYDELILKYIDLKGKKEKSKIDINNI